MRTKTHRSLHATGRSPLTASFALLACWLVASVWPLHAAWGQPDPNGLGSRRTPPGSTARAIAARIAETTPDPLPPHSSAQANSLPNQMGSASVSSHLHSGLTQRLWESRVEAPDPNEDADTREDLKNLIEKVRALKFESNEATPAFTAPAEPNRRTEPDSGGLTTQARPNTTTAPVPMMTRPVESGRDLSPETMVRLGGSLQDPNQVRNPLEMAELLFLSGHPVEASGFYEKALAQTTRGDSTTDEDRAWILFQLGNCLRETDMTKARDAYLRLVSEYPDSPWTELARAHGRLISWYLTARPRQLMSPQGSP